MTTKNERLIKYLGLGYDNFVKDQLEWAKIYYPESAQNLENKASSARMMLDFNAFVGDVLSFYIEDRFRNSNLVTANDLTSIINNAESLGSKFNGPTAANGYTNFYLEVPSTTGSSGNYLPDMRYAINFKNVQLQNNKGVVFEALEDVDFSKTNISSSANVVVSKRDTSGQPQRFVLKTSKRVMAGKTQIETFAVGDFVPFKTIKLANKNVLQVLSVVDSSGNAWSEVDYLVQDLVFDGARNNLSDNQDVPYTLKIRAVPRRFIKKIDPKTGATTLVFGNGKVADVGNAIVPDPSLIALDLKGQLQFAPTSIDPQNFITSRTLGLSPYNTTLTIKVRTGGGKITNTAENSLTSIIGKDTDFSAAGLTTSELNNTLSSFTTRNTSPILEGDDAETVQEIKQNASAFFAAQNRLNTREDYIARTMSMPAIFGSVFRVYPIANCDKNGGVQLYILSKNAQEQLSVPSTTLKANIKNYLSLFTRMNQSIDLLNGKILNIGVEYTIVVQPGYNKSKVKFDTLLKVKSYFNINNWQLNQPIIIDEIRCLIKETEGVVSISNFTIKSKSNTIDGNQYSQEVYDISGNTRNNIIFGVPNGIFEVKYPDIDIKAGAI